VVLNILQRKKANNKTADWWA